MILPAGNHEWFFHSAETFDTNHFIRTMGTKKPPRDQPGYLVYIGSKTGIEMAHGNYGHFKVFIPFFEPFNKFLIKKNEVLSWLKIPIVTSAYLCRQAVRPPGKDEQFAFWF